MGHDNARVRIDLEQRLETQQVQGRLQEPAHRANAAGLEKLQKSLVPAKVPHLVGFVGKPFVVARQVGLGEILVTAEVQRRDAHAFLGRVGSHVVLHAQVRNEPEQLVELLADGVQARIVQVVCRCWCGVGEQALPAQRRAVRGIPFEERLEDRRAGSRHADDEDGFVNGFIQDRGLLGDCLFDEEARIGAALQSPSHGELAERTEPGLGLQGSDQALQSVLEHAVPEIESADRPCSAKDPVGSQTERLKPERVSETPGPIDEREYRRALSWERVHADLAPWKTQYG